MKNILVMIFGIIGFMSTSCTRLLAGMAAPEKIIEVPIDIGRENIYKIRIDFKTDKDHRGEFNKVGPYSIGLKDPSLEEYSGDSWKKN